jgi:hypothetical protein
MTTIDPGDGFDAFAQRVAVALRDHADTARAMPDLDAMRAMLEAACAVAPVTGEGRDRVVARPPTRVLAAAACSLLVLGGVAVVAATGGRGSAAPTLVADESLMAEARRAATAPPGTTPATSVPAPVITEPDVAPTTTPAPSTTAVPPTTPLLLAAVSNDLQPVPTTVPPPVTAPPSTEPEPPAPEVPAPTTTVKPPKATTTTPVRTTTTVSPYAFTVKQRWKTSSATPPFEEFSGTAQPGATITITSVYGGGTTIVGPTGAWAARVEFPTAPVGTKFTGKVKTAQGQKSFTFTRTAA